MEVTLMKAQQEYEFLTECIEVQKERELERFIETLESVVQESEEKTVENEIKSL